MPRKKYRDEKNDTLEQMQLQVENKLTVEEIQKLQNLRITLRHEVPEQHKIERNAGSHAPSKEERERFKQYCNIKNGIFSPHEDMIITGNWKAFCKLHGWKKKKYQPFLYMRHRNAIKLMPWMQDRKKFVQFLADGLPNRTLYSVYQRFRNLYNSHLTTYYTAIEDETILDHIENNPDVNQSCMFADLAKILNRTRASVWRRYRLLKQKRKKSE